MLTLLAAPVTNDRSPRYAERAFAAIHQARSHGEAITLLYAAKEEKVGLFLEFPDDLQEFVVGPMAAHYPNCALTTVDAIDPIPAGWQTWSAAVKLSPEIFPILRHGQCEDTLTGTFADPVSGILRAVAPADEVHSCIEIRIAPAARRRERTAARALRLLDREFFRHHHRLAEYYAEHVTRHGWFPAWLLGLLALQSPHPVRTTIDTGASRQHDREEDLQAASAKIGGHLFETHIYLVAHAPADSRRQAHDRIRQMAGALGAFTQSRLATFHVSRIRRGPPAHARGEGSLCSHEEIGTLYHPPTATAGAERMQSTEFRELEPPARFLTGDEPKAVTLGRVLFREDSRTIGMDEDARRRHVYVVGATGAGKSTLLLNLMRQDMMAGRGLTVIDVHGDLAAAVLRLVPKHRTNDTIVFDPASDQVVPFNPLACPDPARVDQVASGAVSALKKLYDSWGPRLESLLRSAVFTTVEQNGTMLDLLRLLTDKAYRDSVVLQGSDEVVRSFWLNEFAHWSVQYKTEAVASVTNKLMPFLTSRRLRAVTGATATESLDLRQVMDERRILIASISRGAIGQDNATLLGSLLLTCLEQAALSRAALPEADRRDHYLYLDEFQSLVTPSTAILLSEARKYRVCLTLSHQLTRQLDPATYHAVVGNCATLVSFRVGLEDAQLLAPAFSKHEGQLAPADLCNLPNFTAYVRLLTPDGHPSRPFSMRTLPPPEALDDPDRQDIVRQVSARRYARPVQPV